MTALAVLAGCVLRAYWAWMLPFNDAPDEYCHYAMVEYLRTEQRLPTMADVPDRIPVSYPALSPFGYLPLVFTSLFVGADDPDCFRAMRMGNIIVGTATLLAGLLATQRLAPNSPWLGATTTWALALHPQLVFINASINNDSTMILFCTAVWLVWMAIARDGITDGLAMMLAAASAGAFLSKFNAVGVILAGTPIAGWHIVRAGKDWATPLRKYSAAGLLAGLICSPWFVWSWTHHHSITGIEIHRQWWFAYLDGDGIVQGRLTLENAYSFAAGTFKSYWAAFGYCSTFLPAGWYVATAGLVGFSTLVAMVLVWRQVRTRNGWEPETLAMVGTIALGGSLVLAAHLFHSRYFGLSAQGRYLMPAEWGLMVGMVWVVGEALPRARVGNVVVVALLAGMQWQSIRVEQASNFPAQPNPFVSLEVLSHLHRLPGERKPTSWWTEPVGSARVERTEEGFVIEFISPGDAINLELPNLGRASLVVEQRVLGGSAEGRLTLRSQSGNPIVAASYRSQIGAVCRAQFDVTGLAEGRLEEVKSIQIQPASYPARVVISDILVRDQEGRQVMVAPDGHPTLMAME